MSFFLDTEQTLLCGNLQLKDEIKVIHVYNFSEILYVMCINFCNVTEPNSNIIRNKIKLPKVRKLY